MADDILAFATRFSPFDMAEAMAAITARPPGAPFAYVATPNAVHVVGYQRGDPRFHAGINGAWLRLCDSRVVSRLANLAFGTRVPLALGSDLTTAMVRKAIRADDAITIIGGTAEMERRLREQFGWRNLYRHEPPQNFISDRDAVARCIDFVLAHPARYVFIACGAPQSELLGMRIVEQGGAVGTGLCIGASLLFVTGLQRRAPTLWQRAGLEWLHRLLLEPRRMSKRLVTSQLPLLRLALRRRGNDDDRVRTRERRVGRRGGVTHDRRFDDMRRRPDPDAPP